MPNGTSIWTQDAIQIMMNKRSGKKFCDTNHVLSSDYSEVMIVGAGADAVDFKLISLCHQGDIVVT